MPNLTGSAAQQATDVFLETASSLLSDWHVDMNVFGWHLLRVPQVFRGAVLFSLPQYPSHSGKCFRCCSYGLRKKKGNISETFLQL